MVYRPKTLLTSLLGAIVVINSVAAEAIIPESCFNSYSDLETYFDYLYPWGSDHNGGARMVGNASYHKYVSINQRGVLALEASPVTGQPPSTYNTHPAIHYLSGAVHSRKTITVAKGDKGYDLGASFVAPTKKGTWPAFWLNGAWTWPPEIDLAEWKGNGKISYNTFNSSSSVASSDQPYPVDGGWHSVHAEIRNRDDSNLSIRWRFDGQVVETQYAKAYVGKPLQLIINLQMEGSSGSPGPSGSTTFKIKELYINKV